VAKVGGRAGVRRRVSVKFGLVQQVSGIALGAGGTGRDNWDG